MGILTKDIKSYIDRSVLCWLATCYKDQPNVSPKEMWTYKDDETIIIANIASPQSVKNIQENPNISLSFVDVFIQKGYQLYGKAAIIDEKNNLYRQYHDIICELYTDAFPIASFFEIKIESVRPILAPSYLLYPDTSEETQINQAKKIYGL